VAKTDTTTKASARKRRADAERNIQAIIDAALEELADDPDASMAAIARRAGVVRATVYMHFPTREALLDAVMEDAVGQVAEATRAAEPTQGEPEEALQRVLRATWHKLSDFQTLLAINTSRLSAKELHRRHQPVMTQFVPLIERGQANGVFRSDVPVSWHLAMIRAIAHAASAEVRSGRIPVSEAESAMLTTALAAVTPV
jgi:AcrR family transcriptional regulator